MVSDETKLGRVYMASMKPEVTTARTPLAPSSPSARKKLMWPQRKVRTTWIIGSEGQFSSAQKAIQT